MVQWLQSHLGTVAFHKVAPPAPVLRLHAWRLSVENSYYKPSIALSRYTYILYATDSQQSPHFCNREVRFVYGDFDFLLLLINLSSLYSFLSSFAFIGSAITLMWAVFGRILPCYKLLFAVLTYFFDWDFAHCHFAIFCFVLPIGVAPCLICPASRYIREGLKGWREACGTNEVQKTAKERQQMMPNEQKGQKRRHS